MWRGVFFGAVAAVLLKPAKLWMGLEYDPGSGERLISVIVGGCFLIWLVSTIFREAGEMRVSYAIKKALRNQQDEGFRDGKVPEFFEEIRKTQTP
jgi:hypothetical protein